MKKVIAFASFFALAAILFTACKKSDDTPSTLQRLQAKWTFQKDYYHEVSGGVESRDTTTGTGAEYADFRTDGKVYSRYSATQYDTAAYSLLGDNKIVTTYTYFGIPYNDTVEIVTLTDNSLQVHSKYFDPAPDYYEDTYIYSK